MTSSWRRAVARTKAVKQDNPLKMETMIGAQASLEQMEKIKSYLDLGKKEGAKVLCGGNVAKINSGLEKGNYIEPTIFEGKNDMSIFQEEIFGPVVSVTKFKDEKEALEIANDTLYGLGAGVWTRNGNRALIEWVEKYKLVEFGLTVITHIQLMLHSVDTNNLVSEEKHIK